MNKTLITLSLASLLALSSTQTFADKQHRHDNSFKDMAKVVHVEPIYTSVRIATPQRECYQTPQYHSSNSQYQSYTSTIAGGIIGGVVGNQFGGGSGKKIMTAAGALLGGSVGRDLNNQNNSQQVSYREECHVTQRYQQESRIDSYLVTYKYKGQRYTTKMNHRPGKRIPVQISVRPISQYY